MVCTENDFIFGVYSNVHKYLYMYVCDHRKARRTHTEMVMPITGEGGILLYMPNVFIVNFL